MPKITKVNVSQLEFDLENPRNARQESQRQALETMLLSQHKKSVKLAEHIVENGQNPIDLIAVIKSETTTNQYTVLEGNRRAAVLKILNKSILLDSMPVLSGAATTIKKLKQLAAQVDPDGIRKANVVLFDSREEANIWIGLKHTGENEGAGTVMWDGIQNARFREGNDVALSLLEYGREKGWFDENLLTERGAFPISTLNRLIADPNVRQVLGLRLNEGELESIVPPDQLARGIKKIVSDLANRKITVTDLKRKSDRTTYLQSFSSRERPDTSISVEAWPLGANSAKAQAATVTKPRSRAVSTSRTALIPGHFIVSTHIKAPRLNKIYRELKAMSVETYPNAVAVLLRAFIELSLDDFISRHKLKVQMKKPPQASLAEKVTSVVENLKANQRLDKAKSQPIIKLASNAPEDKARPTSITTLHAFVHSLYASPIASELKTIWDDIEPFMQAVTHAP